MIAPSLLSSPAKPQDDLRILLVVTTLLTYYQIKVHADATNFAEGATKADMYQAMLLQVSGLIHGQRNWVREANPLVCDEKVHFWV